MLKWKIGAVTVTKVVESEVALGCHHLLPDADPEALRNIPWMEPYMSGPDKFLMSIHALVVDTPTKRIVVDTCIGNDKPRAALRGEVLATTFLADLAAAGAPRESVDVVLCTHLHVDHVGWNTMLVDGAWVPTFPNARYLIARREFEYWRDEDHDGEAPEIFADSVKPVFDAGLVDLVQPDHRIDETVSLVSTPGHTPGHVSLLIRSEGEEALITGDMIHHPSQLAYPDWGSAFDYDMAASSLTRREQFAQVADRPLLVIGTHFAHPTAGHIVRDGDAWRLAE
jgi:glyoxylase-like metal-dependent hydrolase (beta-lactamase superfamily II)